MADTVIGKNLLGHYQTVCLIIKQLQEQKNNHTANNEQEKASVYRELEYQFMLLRDDIGKSIS
ncbi:MAG: hypothetical protein JWR67_3653 [Mucilaginibacter sp.]|nr:hypothetical protein [Mucilaginibacter sp.]